MHLNRQLHPHNPVHTPRPPQRRWRRRPAPARPSPDVSPVTTQDVTDALAHLRRYSLVTTTTETTTPPPQPDTIWRAADNDAETSIAVPAGWVRVHALLQRVTWDLLTAQQRAAIATAAADALIESWPEEDYRPENQPLATAHRSAATALIARAEAQLWHQSNAGGHPIYWALGRSLTDAGLHEQKVTHWEHLHVSAHHHLGPTHADTLVSGNNLAAAYVAAGRVSEAIPLLEATLRDRERVQGGTHPGTLTTRNNLAGAYRDAGRVSEAIPLLEATLRDRERVLGGTHPDTLGSRNNLAAAYRDAGRATEAIPLLEATRSPGARTRVQQQGECGEIVRGLCIGRRSGHEG